MLGVEYEFSFVLFNVSGVCEDRLMGILCIYVGKQYENVFKQSLTKL